MNSVNTKKSLNLNPNNKLDALCREFDGESFYGLEYIVEDLFQNVTANNTDSDASSVDWFGLYD